MWIKNKQFQRTWIEFNSTKQKPFDVPVASSRITLQFLSAICDNLATAAVIVSSVVKASKPRNINAVKINILECKVRTEGKNTSLNWLICGVSSTMQCWVSKITYKDDVLLHGLFPTWSNPSPSLARSDSKRINFIHLHKSQRTFVI